MEISYGEKKPCAIKLQFLGQHAAYTEDESFLALCSVRQSKRVLWQVPKSLEKLTTVKLNQNSEEGLMELVHASRLAR